MATDVRATPAAGYPAEVTAANWQFPPYNRWGFCNCRRLLPTARVARSTAPRGFSRRALASMLRACAAIGAALSPP
jgi:hypothetical protein